jgi:hypothetical protein
VIWKVSDTAVGVWGRGFSLAGETSRVMLVRGIGPTGRISIVQRLPWLLTSCRQSTRRICIGIDLASRLETGPGARFTGPGRVKDTFTGARDLPLDMINQRRRGSMRLPRAKLLGRRTVQRITLGSSCAGTLCGFYLELTE